MPRVCLVTHYFPPHKGGIEQVSFEQSKRLTEMGYQIDVLTSKFEGRDTNPIKGIKIHHYPSLNVAKRFGVPYPIISFKAYKEFTKIIAKCDLCPNLEVPACVANCPNEALVCEEVEQ